MTTQTMLILLWYLISIFFVVILHETIHFIFAIFFKLKPTLTISKLGTPTVRYKNDNQYSKIFVVAISAPLILTILAFLLPENGYLVMMKIMCGVNFFNLFPFTTDGEVALYSLLHIWRKNEKNNLKIYSLIGILILLILLLVGYFGIHTASGGTGSYDTNTQQFKHSNIDNTIVNMTKGKPGIYYYGFPECPWCQELLPVFNNTLKKANLTSNVVNTHSKKFTKKDQKKLETFFKSNTNKKELTVPLIVMIRKDGKIKVHIGTVKGHNAKVSKMTRNQKNKLIDELTTMYNWYKAAM